MQELPYNEKDLMSIFDYSKRLVQRCLRDFAPEGKELKGKGKLGQLVEKLFFGYAPNSKQEADFSFVNAELKCTPLRLSTRGSWLIKERLVCSMINYLEDWDKTFEQSSFYQKCLIMLILFYEHQPAISPLDLKFIFTVLWQIPDKDLAIMRQDYDIIIAKIRSGNAHTLSEGDTMYLGACRKGQSGDSLSPQYNNNIGAPKRAWSLKTSYMRILLAEVESHQKEGAYSNYTLSKNDLSPLFSLSELQDHSIEDILRRRFAPFIGRTYTEICKMLQEPISSSKAKYFELANKIASKGTISNINRSEEFQKSGLTMKTIRLQSDGRLKESMSFENIDYYEVLDCDEWVDSRLYELFSSQFLFVLWRETDTVLELPNGRCEPEYRLEKTSFWTMSQEDLKTAEKYWKNIRHTVLSNQIDPQHFWRASDKRKFHVRPKGRNATDMTPNPHGGMVRKYCYWFNAQYVKHIIEDEL